MIGRKHFNFQSASHQRGAAIVWAQLGIIGIVALTWFCVARHLPLLEQHFGTGVVDAISPLHAETVNVEMNGFKATLTGTVPSSKERLDIVAAASEVSGIRGVTDNLQIVAAPVTANLDDNVAVDQQSDTLAKTLESPLLNFSVADQSLSVSGRVQDQSRIKPAIELIMKTYDLNYLSDEIVAGDDIKEIESMDELLATIPELSNVKNLSMELFNTDLILGGTVSTESDRQGILELVDNTLASFSIIDQLEVVAEESDQPELPAVTDSDAEETTEIVTTTDATQTTDTTEQGEQQESVEVAARRLRLEAEAEAVAKAEQEAENTDALQAEAIDSARAETDEENQPTEDPIIQVSQKLSTAFANLPDTRILFESGSDNITLDSRSRLETIAELLSEYPSVPVSIKGHTDSRGDEQENLSLSQLRANAVRDFLVARGISVFRLSSFGYGEGLPIATNDTAEGRTANRRIEFSF